MHQGSLIEPLEDRRLMSTGSVTSLTLVDADTDRDLFELTNGMVLNLAKLPTRNLNVRANVSGRLESVLFSLDKKRNYKAENHAPYTVGGDGPRNDYWAWQVPAGRHTLTATPFAKDRARGRGGKGVRVTFTLVDATAPAAPTGASAEAVSPSVVALNWTDAAKDEAGYAVARSADGIRYTQIATLGPDAATFLDEGLTEGTAYQYRVWAFNGAGESGAASAEATTPVKLSPPAVPGDAVAVATSASEVRLGWADLAENEDGYLIERSTDGVHFVDLARLGADATGYVDDDGIAETTTYFYRVSAFNAAGASSPLVTGATTPLRLIMPDAPGNLVAMSDTMTQVTVTWADGSINEEGFRIFRSIDGENFEVVGTVGAGVVSYTDRGLNPGGVYFYEVAAFNGAGESASPEGTGVFLPAPVKSAAVIDPTHPGIGILIGPPQSAVDFAIGQPLVRYNRYIAGGAHTNQPETGEAPMTLALAAYTGNTTADGRLLEQMRYTLTGGNDITSNGGYPAQHERHVTAMFTLARMTPRIWEQLSDFERKKVDLLMKAAFVASAFTTNDYNPYVLAGVQQRAIDGDTNMNRSWNPNYREGMIGGVLVGMVWFGGPENAYKLLETYNHDRFVSELQEYGLSNLYETFNSSNANPQWGSPSGSVIEEGIRNYRYLGSPIDDYMGIYDKLASNTFVGQVACGLNGGLGYDTDGDGLGDAGKILSGCETLPNLGQQGMLQEFVSIDGGGPRSSAQYSYHGWRTHLSNHLVLVAGGFWQAQTDVAGRALSRMSVGSIDLWYKLEHGYSNYQKNKAAGVDRATDTASHFELTRPMWESVIKPFHGIV